MEYQQSLPGFASKLNMVLARELIEWMNIDPRWGGARADTNASAWINSWRKGNPKQMVTTERATANLKGYKRTYYDENVKETLEDRLKHNEEMSTHHQTGLRGKIIYSLAKFCYTVLYLEFNFQNHAQ